MAETVERQVERECHHGFRGVPETDRIATPCPACGWRSLFVGSGGWLTCSSLSCPDPSVGGVVERLKERIAKLEAEAHLQASALRTWRFAFPEGPAAALQERARQLEAAEGPRA